jgi:3-methyladenine DNA glycosylase AlkD
MNIDVIDRNAGDDEDFVTRSISEELEDVGWRKEESCVPRMVPTQ